MYQENKHYDLSHLNANNSSPEKEFNKVIDIALQSIGMKAEDFNSDPKEYDLTSAYMTNWACAWNKLVNVSRRCHIIQKNDKLALVVFKDDNSVSLDKIYRLEDLTAVI